MYKIGNSIDIHPLVDNAPLYIGGVKVESDKGSISHSDGDALTHSIAEAILGALGKDDLGANFDDRDDKYKGISSLHFLNVCKELLKQEGYKISNIDCMIVLEKPRLSVYREQVKKSIANSLEIPIDKVNIKAGTNEKIGSSGNRESYLVWTVVLVEKL